MINKGIEDNKSYQVRVASLECLTTLLQMKSFISMVSSVSSVSFLNNENSQIKVKELCTTIDAVFTIVRNDKKPEVITEAGNALKAWKLVDLGR